MSNIERSKYWLCVTYPDSFDLDLWLNQDFFGNLSGVISPLHCKDNENLKPHYHCIFDFGGRNVTQNGALFVLGDLPANKHLEKPSNLFACERYLTHYDNPDKEQFYKDGELYQAGRFCRIVGNYAFHLESYKSDDKL